MYEPRQCDAMHEIVRVDALNVLTGSQFSFLHVVFLYMLRRDMRYSELKENFLGTDMSSRLLKTWVTYFCAADELPEFG
jgi:hypothetical protein